MTGEIISKVLFFCLLTLLFKCNVHDEGVYEEGYSYYFLVTKEHKINGTILMDTLIMTIGDVPFPYRLIASGQKGALWQSQKTGAKGTRGVTDKNEKLSIQVPTSRFIKGHFIGFSGVIAPYPGTGIPPDLESTVHIEHALPKNYGVVNGEEVIAIGGKTIHKEIQYTDTTFYSAPFLKDSLKCWIMEGENVSHIDEFGRYYIKAWFNKTYGFVRWYYKTPDDEAIEFKLVKIQRE